MTAFNYRAVDASGRILHGELAANSETELDSRLLQIGLQLVTCRPLSRRQIGAAGKKVDRRELINFCFHLEQAHRAGLPILEALRDLRDSTANPSFRNVLASISLAVEGGKSLSEALGDYPATFDHVFVALVRAGERSGELSQVLARMTETLKWQDELIAQTKKLMLYPAFVGTVVFAVVFFLMLYVVPQMGAFLKTMGQDMPLHTRALIATSDVVVEFWYLLLGGPVVLGIMGNWLVRHDAGSRRAFDRLKLQVWVFGPILSKIIMSRFVTYFQIMYASGITIVDVSDPATPVQVGNLSTVPGFDVKVWGHYVYTVTGGGGGQGGIVDLRRHRGPPVGGTGLVAVPRPAAGRRQGRGTHEQTADGDPASSHAATR